MGNPIDLHRVLVFQSFCDVFSSWETKKNLNKVQFFVCWQSEFKVQIQKRDVREDIKRASNGAIHISFFVIAIRDGELWSRVCSKAQVLVVSAIYHKLLTVIEISTLHVSNAQLGLEKHCSSTSCFTDMRGLTKLTLHISCRFQIRHLNFTAQINQLVADQFYLFATYGQLKKD